jgi:hypothetical protein
MLILVISLARWDALIFKSRPTVRLPATGKKKMHAICIKGSVLKNGLPGECNKYNILIM